jgi:type IV pilus assembly protein PilB
MKQPIIQDILARSGLVAAELLSRAIETQARDGGSLGRILAGLGSIDEEAVARAVAAGLGLDHADLGEATPPDEATRLLPPLFCRQRSVVPLGLAPRSLRLAMSDPLDLGTIEDVQFRANRNVDPVVASESAIQKLVRRLHPELDQADTTADLIPETPPEGELEGDDTWEVVDPAELTRGGALPPIVRLVNAILTDAAKAGASDIHMEPQENSLLVRQRIDGLLHDVRTIPKHLQPSVVSRLKIISGMDIAERRRPQDGRSRLRVQQRRIDLRVSTLPTQHGEKVVVRLLDSVGGRTELRQLGFADDLLQRYLALLSRPQGMILVTGPTGSGKTSTLYASLNSIKSPVKNIITVEDPIEYQLAGINQVQINSRAGVTFAAGLRSILRQDPNVVLVGEIRDQETAGIALEAGQTGHLILSTMHTNDAPSSITRLIDLGVEPFMVSSSVIGLLAQRLVRRVCVACATEREPAPALLEPFGGEGRIPATARFMSGAGCAECAQSGYHGRLAVHELLVMTDALRDLVSRRSADHRLREGAHEGGMRFLWEDGLDKAAQGLTTLEEVLRVAPPDEGGARVAPARPDRSAVAPVAPAAPRQAGEGDRPRVLVVEDSPTVVTVVRYFLELEGFVVLVAEDGVVGLETARREMPDIVVSDINMPGMDGMTLTRELRSDPRTAHMAILMLTSEASPDTEAAGLEIGADDYIVKPVEPKRLAARVKVLLARARSRRPAA